MLRNLKKKKKGFTLIELIIVIAIIAVISAIAIPRMLNTRNQANDDADRANAKTIANAAITAIAEGAITPSGLSGAILTTGVALPTVEPATEDANMAAIRDRLQGVPTTHTPATGNFVVAIAADGGVTVFNTAATPGQLFPHA